MPCAQYLLRNGRLTSFVGRFRMCQGPAFAWFAPDDFAVLLCLFALISLLESGVGVLLWNGSRPGAILSSVLLPVEIAFWLGFALATPSSSSRSSARSAGWSVTRPPGDPPQPAGTPRRP